MPQTFQEFDRSGRELDFVHQLPTLFKLSLVYRLDSVTLIKESCNPIQEQNSSKKFDENEECDRERDVIRKLNNVI